MFNIVRVMFLLWVYIIILFSSNLGCKGGGLCREPELF